MPTIRDVLSLFRPIPDDATDWRAMRDARLRRTVVEAAVHCPFYREWLNSHRIVPTEIRSAEDVLQIPVLTRGQVRAEGQRMVREDVPVDTCSREMTSGTTGEPTTLYTRSSELRVQHALWLSGYLRAGLRPWHRQAKFIMAHRIPEKPRPYQRVGILRRAYFPTAAPTVEKLDWLRRLRPDALFSWGSLLSELANQLEQEQDELNIPLIVSTSDKLQRELVAARIKGRLLDVYGSIETGPVAWGCGVAEGYHIDPRWVHVELVAEDGQPARRGTVVCTPMWRRIMPLIRYQLGDIAEWADTPCPCGNPLPRIRSLIGRHGELLSLPNGVRLSANVVAEAVRQVPGIQAFQFAQRSETESVLFLVPGPEMPSNAVARVRDLLTERLGAGVQVQVKCVPALYRAPDVKFRASYPLVMIERLRCAGVDVERILAQ